MKKLVISLLLFFSIFASKGQSGFANIVDFNPLNNNWWPYNETIYFLRGTSPIGNVRILTHRGTWQTRIHSDSVLIPKLSLMESPNPYKLVTIGQDSLLRAFTPNYLTSINSGLVVTALGYTPINPNGTSLQYFGGDGSLIIFPSIPAAQINSDWSAISGLSQILNKPTIPAIQVNSDWNSISGLSQILNKPTLKKVETFLGTTDGSGNYTIVYGIAYSATPDVQPQIQAGTVTQSIRITATSTTGFTVQVTNRAVVSLLGIDLVAGTATPVSGSSVGVLVTSR